MAKLNAVGGLSGAGSGASAGAAIGSVIPGVGTAIGGAVGGIIGGISGLFGKKKKKKKKVSTLDKKQQALNEAQHESIFGKGPLADLYNYDPQAANAVFDQNIANPEYRNFKEKLAPEITGQFRSKGLINSSYAGDALSKAARDIEETLAGKRAAYLYGEQSSARNAKQQAVENLQNRQTFAYNANQGGGSGSTLDQILQSINPESVGGVMDLFKKVSGGA